MTDKFRGDASSFRAPSQGSDPAEDDTEISLRPLFRVLWSYRRAIAAIVSGVAIVFAIGALGVYLRQPAERQATLEFRLAFSGAERNVYPNGMVFSPAEIIASPIVNRV